MQITRNAIETMAGPSEWFTGAVYVDTVATPSGPSRLQASSVHFTPGARTAWHTHPNGQTIYVTEGIGLAQRRGEPIEVIRPGDRVFSDPGRIRPRGPRVLIPGGSGPVLAGPMEGRVGVPWWRRPAARRHGAGGLLRRLLPSEHAARGGATGRLPRHTRRARALRPRGEAARGPAAARVSPPAPLRSEGAQAALGGCRPAADADRGRAVQGGRLADMGSDQLGNPVVEGR